METLSRDDQEPLKRWRNGWDNLAQDEPLAHVRTCEGGGDPLSLIAGVPPGATSGRERGARLLAPGLRASGRLPFALLHEIGAGEMLERTGTGDLMDALRMSRCPVSAHATGCLTIS